MAEDAVPGLSMAFTLQEIHFCAVSDVSSLENEVIYAESYKERVLANIKAEYRPLAQRFSDSLLSLKKKQEAGEYKVIFNDIVTVLDDFDSFAEKNHIDQTSLVHSLKRLARHVSDSHVWDKRIDQIFAYL